MLQAAVGVEHRSVAAAWHNLGGIAHSKGEHERAEPMARRAVQIRGAALGDDHLQVATERHERWDSLRTLTPNWMNRLPGLPYTGDDPDGYMSAVEVADSLERYRQAIDAPVRTGTTVIGLRPASPGWHVETDLGPWRCRAVVIATGADQPTPHPRGRRRAAGRGPPTEPDAVPEFRTRQSTGGLMLYRDIEDAPRWSSMSVPGAAGS